MATTKETASLLFAALAAWEDESVDVETAKGTARARLADYEALRAAGGPEPLVTTGGYLDRPGDRMAADLRAMLGPTDPRRGMTARDARFLISELLLIANVHDGDLARTVEGAVAMGSIEARPTSFTTALIDGKLSILFRTPDGPKRFHLDVTEA